MMPVLYRFGPVSIHSYGLMLMIGFFLGILWGVREAKHRSIAPEYVVDYALWALLSSIVGARLVFVLLDAGTYLHHPLTILEVWQGGLSFHGGFAAALLALWAYCRRHGLRLGTMADLVAPCVPLGYASARIGCFLNGCCYGVPTSLPWGMRFPDPHGPPGALTPPSHPVQLYAVGASLAIFGLVLAAKRFCRAPGQLAFVYMALYSVYRFLIESLRRGATAQPLLGLTLVTEGQAVSVVMFAVAAAAYWRIGRKDSDETGKTASAARMLQKRRAR